MASFTINEGFPSDLETIKAHEFVSNGDFVDFLSKSGVILFRMHASKVVTVRRELRAGSPDA